MIIRITFKDCNAVSRNIENEIRKDFEKRNKIAFNDVIRKKRFGIERSLEKWIEYNEYITIEFDTDEGTAKVLELKMMR